MSELELRLKFTEEDRPELMRYLQADDIAIVLERYDQWLRNKIKYEELSEKTLDIYQECRTELNSIASDHNVRI